MNPLVMEVIANQRHADLLHEAETYRLLNELEAQRPAQYVSILAHMGNIFTTVGQKLRRAHHSKQPGMLQDL